MGRLRRDGSGGSLKDPQGFLTERRSVRTVSPGIRRGVEGEDLGGGYGPTSLGVISWSTTTDTILASHCDHCRGIGRSEVLRSRQTHGVSSSPLTRSWDQDTVWNYTCSHRYNPRSTVTENFYRGSLRPGMGRWVVHYWVRSPSQRLPPI